MFEPKGSLEERIDKLEKEAEKVQDYIRKLRESMQEESAERMEDLSSLVHASEHETGGNDLVDHDSLPGFVDNEHLDWTNASSALATSSTIKGDGIILEGGTHDTTLDAGTPSVAVTYTLPADDGDDGQVLKTDGGGQLAWIDATGEGTPEDHGALTGLADDDHSQYYNAARHIKALHDALNIDADTVDGEEASAIVTNARVKAHFPDTIANVLSNHTKAVHDTLNIDADTIDSLDSTALEQVANKGNANGYCDLDSSAKVPIARLAEVLNLGSISDVTLGSLEEGETLAYDQGTSEWIDAWGVEYDNPRLVWKMYTDFLRSHADANNPWTGVALGGATATQQGSTADHPGSIRLNCSTSINSGYYFLTDTNSIIINGREASEFVFKSPATFTNKNVRMGFQDSTSSTLPTDGVYINVSGSTLSGKTRKASSGSTTATTYTLSANTWYRAKLAVNDAASLVTYKLYNTAGTQLWTNTLATNIPTAQTGHGVLAYIAASASAGILVFIDMMVASKAGSITR